MKNSSQYHLQSVDTESAVLVDCQFLNYMFIKLIYIIPTPSPLQDVIQNQFSSGVWIDRRADQTLERWYGNQSKRRKTLTSNL